MQENIGNTITKLLSSGKPELIHRALVIVIELIQAGGKDLAVHMASCNVIESINNAITAAITSYGNNDQQVITIHKIAQDAAHALFKFL